MGIVTKTIGTAGGPTRDYSTLQAWEDALPADLVNDGNSQVGECYNDGEFVVAGQALLIAGETTSATYTITLTTASGQSFRDHADRQTNPLRYDASKGVGIRTTAAYSNSIDVQVDNVILRGLQVAYAGGNARAALINNSDSDLAGIVAEFCIFEANCNASAYVMVWRHGTMRNCLAVNRNAGKGIAVGYPGTSGALFVNVTSVRPSDLTASLAAFDSSGGVVATLKNCAAFGFTDEVNVSARFTATTCATDKASPMTGFTGSLVYANQFENGADATRDFRAKAGGGLLDTGTTDTTNAANDIVGTSRPQGSAYDIGCWEKVASSSGSVGVGLVENFLLNRRSLVS